MADERSEDVAGEGIVLCGADIRSPSATFVDVEGLKNRPRIAAANVKLVLIGELMTHDKSCDLKAHFAAVRARSLLHGAFARHKRRVVRLQERQRAKSAVRSALHTHDAT